MAQEILIEKLQGDLLLLVEYLGAVRVPDITFLKVQTGLLLEQIEELGHSGAKTA